MELASSAFFDGSGQVDSLMQAVSLLGLETVEGLVLASEINSRFDEKEIEQLTGVPLWDHSMSVGIFSKEIARLEKANREIQGKAFLVGMLHDVGKLLLAANFPEQYRKVVALSNGRPQSVMDGELRVFGVTHAEVGAFLLCLWGLPDFIAEAIAYHHQPGESPCLGFNLQAVVYVADMLAYAAEHGLVEGEDPLKDDMYQLNKLGLSDRFEAWKKHCLNFLEPASI
jgi:putative nucleotidyltransferase with HDIG domain